MPDVFTPQEVHSLNEYQNCGFMHPFTCGSGQRTEHLDGEGILVATTQGWVCPYCDYRQNWAHDTMKNGTWKDAGAYQVMRLLHERSRIFAELDTEMVKALRDLSKGVVRLDILHPVSETLGAALLRAKTVLGKLSEHGLLSEDGDDAKQEKD